jgi:hypothetical protein
MSTILVKYEAARYALQIASKIDEVKDIRDKALAMAAYARQAKDDDLINWATALKLRAERRAGEMLAESEMNKGGRPKETANTAIAVSIPTLSELGLSDKQSSDFQAIAAIPEAKFDKAVASGKATTASLVRSSPNKKTKPAPKEKSAPKSKPEPVEDLGDTMVKELEANDKTIRDQQELIESLNKSDLGAEVEKWKLKFDKLEGRLQQCVTTKNEAERQAKYSTGLLAKIRKALRIEKNSEILEAISDLRK